MKKLFLLLLLSFSIPVMSQVDIKPVLITDEATKKALTDSYKAILAADKDFQIALLKARIKYKVDETWIINLDTLTFIPPPASSIKEEKKEVKP